MRAIAWAFKFPGDVNPSSAWLTTGTTVVRTSDDWDDLGWVFQWNYATVEDAWDKCIRQAERADANQGQLVVGPFFIDLSAEVTKEIRLNANGGRYPAPLLHDALYRLLK